MSGAETPERSKGDKESKEGREDEKKTTQEETLGQAPWLTAWKPWQCQRLFF